MATARRSWVVFVDDDRDLQGCDEFTGKYSIRTGNTNKLCVFFRESQATAYAATIATRYPGKEVHIFVQHMAYSSQPRPPEVKMWTKEGELLPK